MNCTFLFLFQKNAVDLEAKTASQCDLVIEELKRKRDEFLQKIKDEKEAKNKVIIIWVLYVFICLLLLFYSYLLFVLLRRLYIKLFSFHLLRFDLPLKMLRMKTYCSLY